MILPNNNLQLLCKTLGLTDIDHLNPINYESINQHSIQVIQNNNGVLSYVPPFEKHPYLEEINCTSTKGLMIGTFPPISYLCDQLEVPNLTFNRNRNIPPPDLPYFHGNYSSLWKYCPINFENILEIDRNEQPLQIKNALQQNNIAYTDIIAFCQRELRDSAYTAEDRLLNNIVLNNSVFTLIFRCANIDRLYFTNASFFGSNYRNNHLFDRNGNYILDNRDAFRLFLKGAHDQGYKIEIARNEVPENWYQINEGPRTNNERHTLNRLLTTKVILRMRLSINGHSKILQLYSAVSPAAVNRGAIRNNNCVLNFREDQKCTTENAPKELLKRILWSFFDNRIDGLINYNYNAD